ncbi:hypothetical protein QIS74_09246 [Colletotrichum tabaci]|uniref:Uncharacterized protein n=1 Tax=Colletotrichum tabaci TaxID=1209068 RepID=A0AAV9T3T2_9PEZI
MFARDLQVLAAFQGISDALDLETLHNWRNSGSFYLGEYLSQGRLAIDPRRSCQVSMQELVDRGLFDVCPGLGEEANWHRWGKRVNELRMEMEQPFLPAINATIVQTAVDVAMAFEHFELPVAIILLGISPYDLPNSVTTIIKVLLDNYTKEKLQSTVSLTWFMFGADTEKLLEIERWRDLHIL